MPPEYKKMELAAIRRQAGINLYNILQEFTTPAVVRITEEVIERTHHPDYGSMYLSSDLEDQIHISFDIQAAQHMDVRVYSGPYDTFAGAGSDRLKFGARLKRAIRYIFKG